MVSQFRTIQRILSQAKLHPVYLLEITSPPPKDVLDNPTNVPNAPSDVEDANTEVELVQEYIEEVNVHTVGSDKVHDSNSNTVQA